MPSVLAAFRVAAERMLASSKLNSEQADGAAGAATFEFYVTDELRDQNIRQMIDLRCDLL